MTNKTTIFTIGHSNRSAEELLRLVLLHGIKILVGIRAQPHSRRFPHFNQEILRDSINKADIEYHWAGRQLGGKREFTNSGRHQALIDSFQQGFAEYMEIAQFQQAIVQLISLSDRAPLAIMCAEKLPKHCHRSLIADYLVLQNVTVKHIVNSQTLITHELNRLARTESATLIYDRNTTTKLDLH